MASAQIIDFARERAFRAEYVATQLADYDHLECPRCSRLTPPSMVSSDFTVLYECKGPGHHADFAWRIDENGDMMKGRAGNRYYR